MKAKIKTVGHVYQHEDQYGYEHIYIGGWEMEGTKVPTGTVRDTVGGWELTELAAIGYVKHIFGELDALALAKQLARGIK